MSIPCSQETTLVPTLSQMNTEHAVLFIGSNSVLSQRLDIYDISRQVSQQNFCILLSSPHMVHDSPISSFIMLNSSQKCGISGSHGGDYEDVYFLRFTA